MWPGLQHRRQEGKSERWEMRSEALRQKRLTETLIYKHVIVNRLKTNSSAQTKYILSTLLSNPLWNWHPALSLTKGHNLNSQPWFIVFCLTPDRQQKKISNVLAGSNNNNCCTIQPALSWIQFRADNNEVQDQREVSTPAETNSMYSHQVSTSWQVVKVLYPRSQDGIAWHN